MNERYKIGYIDEDPNQVVNFKYALKNFEIDIIGFDIKHGMSLENILELAYSSNIDLLMIDFLLTDKGILNFNGDEIERRFNMLKPGFPHIIFTSEEPEAFNFVDDPNIIYDKEMATNPNTVKKFADTLKKIIENYRRHINIRKEKIAYLLEKGDKEILSPVEEDTLISLQRELRDLDKTKPKEIPEKLLSYERLNDLSETRKKAERYLQLLIEQNKK